ncbi:hypothetical protein ACFQV6_37200 [Actinoplanes sp. GCM10030250]
MRVMPAGREEWGRAMRAELAVVTERADRWRFARGCVFAAAAEFHLVRGAVHLAVVLATLGTLFAWIGAVDYPPLTVVLSVMVPVLAAVCWEARRAGMFGPVGGGVTAWLLRVGGYLVAAVIAVVAVAHAHPATLEAADDGAGILVFATLGAGFLIALVVVCAKRSKATPRVLVTGVGSGLAATAVWLISVVTGPPIPATAGRVLMLAGLAAVVAVLANSGRAGTTGGTLLAGLLAVATTMVLTFAAVVLLAHWGPDSLIPAITPHAMPANRVAESRIEIVDPYVLILVLSAVAATALSLTAVVTRSRVTPEAAASPIEAGAA